jgi:hypothetical protein
MLTATQIEFETTTTLNRTWKVVHASKFHPSKHISETSKQTARHLKEEEK